MGTSTLRCHCSSVPRPTRSRQRHDRPVLVERLFASHRPAEAIARAEAIEAAVSWPHRLWRTAFQTTPAPQRWRADVERLSATSELASQALLGNSTCCDVEKRFADMRALLDRADEPLFRQHNHYGTLSRLVPQTPRRSCAVGNGSMAGDAKGAAQAGTGLAEYLATEKPATWNAWWFALLEAEANLFKGEKALAATQASHALSLLRKYPGFAGSVYARSRAARILRRGPARRIRRWICLKLSRRKRLESVRPRFFGIRLTGFRWRETPGYRDLAEKWERAIKKGG